ncbi:DUF4249 domain-containing protein [Antarcticibacterium flavum]|uniref:DUF4249 domain-containing protein n=1 Tax=Antarcticibacterium flavum TaxID=2058175 RepID=A0A5B7X2T2_9FLAO|nr:MULTISPECIES: DUF4249 domain-containing protein [Antarcticibacterium]MCM4160971.1 hypothetical protein [Antarcticibacterium sp. W02-3]QCY69012.1 DUF4249 domain-containing protein [Antarcticibacterium flavum]
MKIIGKYNPRFLLLFLTVLLLHSCIEPYDYEAETFEDALVVEATITDELKRQEVLLTRSFMVGGNTPAPQTGADVRITDESGNIFLFEEAEPGRYFSREEFAAVAGRNYRLHIVVAGSEYESDPTTLQVSSPIDELYARRTNYNGDDGVALFIDNYNSPDAARYYRYKYEETYKIISRYSNIFDLTYIDGEFVEVLKTKEETTCYNTVASNDIILAATTSLQENNLEGLLVRFIETGNPISSRRYSILVRQYALSPEAFAYYETLKKLAGADNVFSQNQPGFVVGNIYNVNDPEEKVVGMFNVSSFSSKRIYFNYSDFYGPQDSRPHFTDDCDIGTPSIIPQPREENLISLLEMGWVKYLGPSGLSGEDAGPYQVVNAECVDCTLLGTNEVPEFWLEE